MELLPLFAKLFGPVFARMLFAYALRNTNLDFLTGGDIAETLADSLDIAGVVDGLSDSDRIAKRNAPFIFETIGDEVAERVAELFVRENETPAESEMEQALEAAKAAMNSRGLALLIETKFDRIAFRRGLSATPPPAPGWSEQQRDYYRRILAISADALFAAAEQIPHFTRDTTGQLLQDTEHLLDGMRRGLDNQREILAQSYGHQRRGERNQFEQDYRTSLASALDRLTLFGVEKVDGARQPLSVAFVKMRLAHIADEMDDKLGDETDPEEADARLRLERRHPDPRTEILSVQETFSRSRRLVVVAPAGLGKTTLLRWAAVQMARHPAVGDIPLWQGRIPFYLQLRDYSQKPLPPIADLPLAYRGDGMELLARSAPDGWAREQLRGGGAAIFVDGLDEINEAKRAEAIGWVESLMGMEPEILFVLSGRPAALDRESTQPELTRLGFEFVTLQPLDDERIDGFVAQWHAAMAHTDCKYPDKSRIPAREKRLTAALAQRPELRRLAATPLIGAMLCALNLTESQELPRDRIRLYNRCVDMLLDRDEARQVDLTGYGVNPLRPDSARRHLGEIAFWMLEREQSTIDRADAARLIASQGLDGERIARYLAERSGLLQPQSQDVYDFAHRTFQEFLAAQHIAASHRVVPVVKQNAGKKEWQETIALMAGFVQPGDQRELLETLLAVAQTSPKEARNYHLLAWAFWDLLDQRIHEATELISLHAFSLCENDGRSLDLSTTRVEDVTPLEVLTSLRFLDLSNTQVSDIAPLRGLTNLLHLYLSNTSVQDVTSLAGLSNLQYLNLVNTSVRDVASLTGLNSLLELNLINTQVEDFLALDDYIARGKVVISLNLEQISRLHTNLKNLTGLRLAVPAATDIAPLAGLTSVHSLSLRYSQVKDLTPLAALINLQKLDLMNTKVQNLKPLANLTNLRYLDIRNTRVRDVTPLKALTNLQYLDLGRTHVRDVTPLAGLKSLQKLDLNSTRVTDVSPLAHLTNLRIIR